MANRANPSFRIRGSVHSFLSTSPIVADLLLTKPHLSQLISMQFYDNSDDPNPNTEVFYELLSSGKFKGQNFAAYLVAKITQLNSRGDEAEYVRLRSLLDGMTFSTEQGDNLREFLHALRKVMITTAEAPRRWQVPCPQELLVQRTGNPGPFKSLRRSSILGGSRGLSLAASGTSGGGLPYQTRIPYY